MGVQVGGKNVFEPTKHCSTMLRDKPCVQWKLIGTKGFLALLLGFPHSQNGGELSPLKLVKRLEIRKKVSKDSESTSSPLAFPMISPTWRSENEDNISRLITGAVQFVWSSDHVIHVERWLVGSQIFTHKAESC